MWLKGAGTWGRKVGGSCGPSFRYLARVPSLVTNGSDDASDVGSSQVLWIPHPFLDFFLVDRSLSGTEARVPSCENSPGSSVTTLGKEDRHKDLCDPLSHFFMSALFVRPLFSHFISTYIYIYIYI